MGERFPIFNNMVCVETLSAQGMVHRGDLLVCIGNLPELYAAYGRECVRQALRNTLRYRLECLGVRWQDISFFGEHIAVRLSEAQPPGWGNGDLFLERLKAGLAGLPVEFGEDRGLVNILATFGLAGSSREPLPGDPPSGYAIQTTSDSALGRHAAYRDDMATAVDFFEQIRAGRMVLAFQPVRMAGRKRKTIYSEALLRRLVDGDEPASCATEIQALERLGLIDRLDRSVVWAIIETLENNPTVSLGCNVSALSLRHDGWWRLLQNYFVRTPRVAERFTLEVTETSAISQYDEAVSLLHALRLTGCRIAIDDMGAGFSTVDLLIRVRPDVVKIDRAFVTTVPGEGHAPHLLRSLVSLCAGLSPCVVAEGVESEEELHAVLDADAHGVQGYFIERPGILPRWLKAPVPIQDSFVASHRCLASINVTLA